MADPTIQTFCCHRANRTGNEAYAIWQEFDTNAYNTVCMLSSSMGILGAVYQLLPKENIRQRHGSSHLRGRNIIFWLALADLLASLSVFVRSLLWMNFKSIMPVEGDSSDVIFCAISSAWTEYFYMATWIWTLCYAIDMKLLLAQKPYYPGTYHFFAWILPGILTIVGLSILYIPDARCHDLNSLNSAIYRVLPNYCATYILLVTVMIANPILYMSLSTDFSNVITTTAAQITSKERKQVQTVKLKFVMTNVVYYLCWLPNLLNGILLWTMWFNLPTQTVVILWYTMAVTNPLQAFFNAFVYKKWGRREKLRMDWCYKLKNLGSGLPQDNNSSDATESSPLLSPRPKSPQSSKRSINTSSTF